MAPPTKKPRLIDLDARALALATAGAMRDHLQAQLKQLTPLGVSPQRRAVLTSLAFEDDDLAASEIYRAMRTIVAYARGEGRLEASLEQYLIQLEPLWASALGKPKVDGINIELDPSTAMGLALCAAVARAEIERRKPVTAVQLAALSGLSDRQVRLLMRTGELPTTDGKVAARDARRWLAMRGVSWA